MTVTRRARLSTKTISELMTEAMRERRLFQVFIRQLSPHECFYGARGWAVGGRMFRVSGTRATLVEALLAMLHDADEAVRDPSPPISEEETPRIAYPTSWNERQKVLMQQAARMERSRALHKDVTDENEPG